MKEVHNDIEVEPKLQPVTDESFRYRTANADPDARVDIRVRDFLAQIKTLTHSSIRGDFTLHGRSHRSKSLKCLFQKLEGDKKREYGEQINEVEHDSFTPLVFSTCGGMGREVTVVVKRLADAVATKRNESYTRAVTWMRCCLTFSLAKSTIRCVRRSRSIRREFYHQAPVELVHAKARLDSA